MSAICRHCGEPADDRSITVDTDDGTAAFCCHGCRAAWVWISQAGLERYYAHRDPGAPAHADLERFADYALPEVMSHYTAGGADGMADVSLHIGGMRCAACVWLLEQVAERTPGIAACDVSFATHRATVSFDPAVLDLAGVLRALAQPGFDPEPVVPGERSDVQNRERRQSLKRLAVAALFGMQTMMLALALYLGEAYGMTAAVRKFLEFACLVTTLPVLLYAGAPFFSAAIRGLAERRLGMDVPVTLALSIAFVVSVAATLGYGSTVYFDSVAMFVLLLSASRHLELTARHRAEDGASALARMLPDAVNRLLPDGSTERVARRELSAGDRVRLSAGDTVPADGRIESGNVRVDEALLSGESRPQQRSGGDAVSAGAGIASGGAVIVVEKTGAATTLASVGRLIERAASTRSERRGLADRLAGHFVTGVLTVAGSAAVIWSQIDPDRVLPVVLAVLIVACPCALALATPTALASATSRLARAGLLLTRTGLLERFRPGAVLLTDKTGTLTCGQPALVATQTLGRHGSAEVFGIAAALEADSTHPLARAFAGSAAAVQLDGPAETVPGCGVLGFIDGIEYRIGRSDFVAAIAGAQPVDRVDPAGVWLGHAGGWDSVFTIRDTLRADAKASLDALARHGLDIVIASGDSLAAVAGAAAELGIDDYHAAQTPAAKLALLERLRSKGRTVIMLGDGVNDAPVLRAADASIAMGGGTALARSSADAVLTGSGLSPLTTLAEVAAATRRTIRQSAAWAIGYNAVAVSAAAFGFVTPWLAAIGMSASSLLVVANAMRLRRSPQPLKPAANTLASDSA